MHTILWINNLFLIISLLGSNGNPRSAGVNLPAKADKPVSMEASPSLAGMAISLKAATDTTILFKAKNGQETNAPGKAGQKIPYLVLSRNGVLTPGFERTLELSLGNLQVPASGLYASLEIKTQHSDPDLGRGNENKIRVWNEKRFIAPTGDSQSPQSIDFKVTFPQIFEYQRKAVLTPTDYYSYWVTILDAKGNILRATGQPYAFLLENQWRVPLPKVLEATPGAAPRELVLYYYLSIVRRAAQSGLPRRPGQTPDEYSADLAQALPEAGPDVAPLTRAFVEARYSRHPVARGQAQLLRGHWQRLKAMLIRRKRAIGG